MPLLLFVCVKSWEVKRWYSLSTAANRTDSHVSEKASKRKESRRLLKHRNPSFYLFGCKVKSFRWICKTFCAEKLFCNIFFIFWIKAIPLLQKENGLSHGKRNIFAFLSSVILCVWVTKCPQEAWMKLHCGWLPNELWMTRNFTAVKNFLIY